MRKNRHKPLNGGAARFSVAPDRVVEREREREREGEIEVVLEELVACDKSAYN